MEQCTIRQRRLVGDTGDGYKDKNVSFWLRIHSGWRLICGRVQQSGAIPFLSCSLFLRLLIPIDGEDPLSGGG